jgi:hypothetical protein
MTDTDKGAEKSAGGELENVPFSRLNYILFAVGLLVITAGWFLLRGGHISIAPIMLILGYCGIIPLAIVLKQKKTE